MDDKDVQKALCGLNAEYMQLISSKRYKSNFIDSLKTKLIHLRNLIKVFSYFGPKKAIRFIKNRNNNRTDEYKVDEYISKSDNREKIVVYTCIFGNIDNILEPIFTSEDIDYRIITDQEVPNNSEWEKVNIDKFSNLKEMSAQKKNRYCKMFPQKFFPDYKYSIYVDGNILIVGDMYIFVEKLQGKEIGIFRHSRRDDIYDEAAAVVYLGNAPGSSVKKQLTEYKKNGFPIKFGLFENSLIVRKHNSSEVIKLMDCWWAQINTYTIRDQLSFMYCLWKQGLEQCYVASLGDNIDCCPVIRRISHKNKR